MTSALQKMYSQSRSYYQASYNQIVRRILSLAMLLLFVWPLVAGAFTTTGDDALPICCRRAGAHHCMGNMASAPSDGLAVRPPRCPAYPANVPQFQHSGLSDKPASLIFAELLSHPSVKKQTEARARVALDQARQKRGPPTA